MGEFDSRHLGSVFRTYLVSLVRLLCIYFVVLIVLLVFRRFGIYTRFCMISGTLELKRGYKMNEEDWIYSSIHLGHALELLFRHLYLTTLRLGAMVVFWISFWCHWKANSKSYNSCFYSESKFSLEGGQNSLRKCHLNAVELNTAIAGPKTATAVLPTGRLLQNAKPRSRDLAVPSDANSFRTFLSIIFLSYFISYWEF